MQNYSVLELTIGATQWFETGLTTVGYLSGGESAYQRPLYVVLAAVFAISILLAIYLLRIGGLVTDLSEIDGLFVLAMASPPSTVVQQRTKGEPSSSVYGAGWKLVPTGDQHILIHAKDLVEDHSLELDVVQGNEVRSDSQRVLVERTSLDVDSSSLLSSRSQRDTVSRGIEDR